MPFVLYKCSTTNQEKGYIMRCNTVSAVNYSSLGKRNFAFKGVNDVDDSKTKVIREDNGLMYANAGKVVTTQYNSNGQMLSETVDPWRNYCTPKHQEWRYYESGHLKSHRIDNYYYAEFYENGDTFKELSHDTKGAIHESIFNDGGIALKKVIKPGFIEDTNCNTVELLYKKENSQTPYRVLGKDYWGNLIKDITDKAKLLKTKIVENRVLFKRK